MDSLADKEEKHFDDFAKAYNEIKDSPKFAVFDKIAAEQINKTLEENKAKTVLEIGCGTGKLGQSIKNKELVGLDLSKEMLKLASKKNCYLQLIHGNACNLKLKHKFDAVIFFQTLHHIPDYKKALLEAARVLKNNGLLIIAEPLGKKTIVSFSTLLKLFVRLRKITKKEKKQETFFPYSPAELEFNRQNKISMGNVADFLKANNFTIKQKKAVWYLDDVDAITAPIKFLGFPNAAKKTEETIYAVWAKTFDKLFARILPEKGVLKILVAKKNS